MAAALSRPRILAAETWGPRFAPWRLLALARTGHAVLLTHPPRHPVAGCSVALLRTFLGCLYAGSLVLAFAGRPPRRVCVACERMDPARLMSSVVAKRRGQSSCFHPLVQVEVASVPPV